MSELGIVLAADELGQLGIDLLFALGIRKHDQHVLCHDRVAGIGPAALSQRSLDGGLKRGRGRLPQVDGEGLVRHLHGRLVQLDDGEVIRMLVWVRMTRTIDRPRGAKSHDWHTSARESWRLQFAAHTTNFGCSRVEVAGGHVTWAFTPGLCQGESLNPPTCDWSSDAGRIWHIDVRVQKTSELC